MDSLRSRPKKHQRTSAFTIVELLVVIVVIGVLAAITIVSYTGISQRATVASLTSDLTNAVTQLKLDQITNSTYPTNLATANGGKGIPASSGTSYQYSYNNNSNPQTFCITATKGTTSYEITNDSIPTIGGCPGHGVGGVPATTNLILNPSLEANSLVWVGPYWSAPLTIDQTFAAVGTKSVKIITDSPTYGQGAIFWTGPQPAGIYSCSIYIAGTPGVVVNVGGRTNNPYDEAQGSVNVTLTSTFQHITITYTLASSVDNAAIQFRQTTQATGVTMWADGAMCVAGSSVPNYADGNSVNWVWNGNVNSSTSTGPPL